MTFVDDQMRYGNQFAVCLQVARTADPTFTYLEHGPKVGSFLRLICALALMAMSACSQADNSPHKWAEFETVAGQAYPVPKRWLATPNGRLTHNIVLPDSMPKPVPFDFTTARFKALAPFTPSVSEQYWRHLCATEAGQYIFKTVKPVEGLTLMRISTVAPQDEDEADLDSWMYESGFLEIFIGHRKAPENIGAAFINWPFYTYRSVEIPNANGLKWTRVTRNSDERAGDSIENAIANKKWQVNNIDLPTERYAITWRGLIQPADRQNRIAGFEIIVFDRQLGEVLSVLRNFQNGTRTWRNAPGCPELKSSYADPGDRPEVLLALRTLQTSQQATFLQSNDERVSRRMARP